MYNLESLEMKAFTLSYSPKLIGKNDEYTICLYDRNKIIVFGSYISHGPDPFRDDTDFENPFRDPNLILNVNPINRQENLVSTPDNRHTTLGMFIIKEQDSETKGNNTYFYCIKWIDKPFEITWKYLVCQNELPFRRYHTANIQGDKMYVFGGKDEQERITNRLDIVHLSKIFIYPN